MIDAIPGNQLFTQVFMNNPYYDSNSFGEERVVKQMIRFEVRHFTDSANYSRAYIDKNTLFDQDGLIQLTQGD